MDFLKQMVIDVEENNINFYKASDTLWEGISESFQHLINNNGINNIQSQDEFNNLFSYVLDIGNLKKEIPMWLYFNLLKSKDEFGILAKTSALPSDKYDFSSFSIKNRPIQNTEKIINWDYLISVDTIQTIVSKNPKILYEPLNICEIGAGWGRIAYYLTQINKNISYHIFDIPHVLYISHEYLRNNVNHINTYNYEKSKEILKLDANKSGIFFHTPHFLENFKEKFFDLTINIASLQEMNLLQVEEYFKKINLTSKMFYTQQRYSDLDMCYDKYPKYVNWETIIDKDVNFHPLWFEKLYKIN
jgi:hypothetical protein